ncbi:CHAT domain-containing protein [Roseofilum casamattae]|uniref:CHAT domain-containing protein n=1 Tax=Roseofilum casamattae BLCC-M143 TaxID=3022442 RepID=A0ABT7BY93_9CYAN|nr:CHAT domain-containing protein [Roseofilum casamattae]MDJ1184173.1 CHAT domain-containing protein [Roseofilum casamattae BLCC-M143]
MKRIFGTLVALGVWMTPVMVMVGEQPSWGQSQQPSAEEIAAAIRKLIDQAIILQDQGKPQQALGIWQEVLGIVQHLDIKEVEAITWLGIGRNSHDLGKYKMAIEAHQMALSIVKELGDRIVEATTLNNLGAVYDSLSQPQQALGYYQQALPIFQELGNLEMIAMTLSNLGKVYDYIGQPQQALEYYQQSLSIRQEVRDREGKAVTLNNLGRVHHNIGTLQQAIEYYQQALPIFQEVGNRRGEGVTLNNLGGIYSSIGKPQQAIEYYQQALPIFQEVGNRSGEGATLNNLGGIYSSIGKPQQAIEYYQQALPIFQEVGNRSGEGTTLNNLGGIYSSIGELQRAIEYYQQALSILQEAGNLRMEATTLGNLGATYQSMGQLLQALEYLEQALPIFRAVQDQGGEATVLSNLGGVYNNIGQRQRAIDYLEQTLPIFRAVQDREGEATVLSNMGFIYRDTNQPKKAIKYWEKSLKITLNLRGSLKQEYRKSFIEINQGNAIALTSLLIEENRAKEAFTWINLVTTYELADYTRLLGAKVQNPEAQARIDEYNQRWQQIESLRKRLQLDFSDDQLSRQIATLETENIKLAAESARQFPEVADIFETTPANIEQLQATIPEGTVVLQPVSLANVTNVPNTLALFLLTRDSFQVVSTSLDVEEFDRLLDEYSRQLHEVDPLYKKNSSKLYDILIRPIETEISAYNPENLSIIATGKLRYLPFESLYDKTNQQFLIEKYPINYLTRLSKTPPNRQPSAKTNAILALGNPVPSEPHNLRGAEEEVKTIAQLFPNSQAYLRDEATLEQFQQQAPKFAFLHLATHGCFQPDGCKTYNMEANTILFANNTQWPVTDAALLGLEHTRLIALSACQTAREADLEGNLIAGLAYLFERAGAQAVMASLWSVSDKHTQTLMSNFYRHVAEGMSQGEALREAKLAQINTDSEDHPFYWSAFLLIGDPR